MSITAEQIHSTAKLAKLRVDDSDILDVTERISAILAMVDQMQATDTEGVAPMANALDATQQLRADHIEQNGDKEAARDAFQRIAPATEEGLYLVPKVIE